MGTLLQVRDLKIGATVYPPGEDPHEIKIVHGVDLIRTRSRSSTVSTSIWRRARSSA